MHTCTYCISVDGQKRLKTNQNEINKRQYHRCVCLQHEHRVQLTSQNAILSFLNMLVWTVKNISKWQCGRKSIDAFSMTTKTHTSKNALVRTGPWNTKPLSLKQLVIRTSCQRLMIALGQGFKTSSSKSLCFKMCYVFAYSLESFQLP